MIKVCQLFKSLRLVLFIVKNYLMNAELSAEQETSRIIQFFSGLGLSIFESYNSWKIRSCIKDLPGVGAFDHLKWTYSGEFERLFGPGEGNLTNTNSQSSNAPGVAWGGGGC